MDVPAAWYGIRFLFLLLSFLLLASYVEAGDHTTFKKNVSIWIMLKERVPYVLLGLIIVWFLDIPRAQNVSSRLDVIMRVGVIGLMLLGAFLRDGNVRDRREHRTSGTYSALVRTGVARQFSQRILYTAVTAVGVLLFRGGFP